MESAGFLPNCWMARSALQGNSSVMWTRRFWFFTRLSAWREIPELEASEIIATSCKRHNQSEELHWSSQRPGVWLQGKHLSNPRLQGQSHPWDPLLIPSGVWFVLVFQAQGLAVSCWGV